MFITKKVEGIPLAFCPPTVRRLRYCAAEVITNYMQFVLRKFIEPVMFPCCELMSLMAVGPRGTRMLFAHLNIYIYILVNAHMALLDEQSTFCYKRLR